MQQIDLMCGVASWWWQRARVVLDDAARAVNEGDSEYVVGAINDGPMYVECDGNVTIPLSLIIARRKPD